MISMITKIVTVLSFVVVGYVVYTIMSNSKKSKKVNKRR